MSYVSIYAKNPYLRTNGAGRRARGDQVMTRQDPESRLQIQAAQAQAQLAAPSEKYLDRQTVVLRLSHPPKMAAQKCWRHLSPPSLSSSLLPPLTLSPFILLSPSIRAGQLWEAEQTAWQHGSGSSSIVHALAWRAVAMINIPVSI